MIVATILFSIAVTFAVCGIIFHYLSDAITWVCASLFLSLVFMIFGFAVSSTTPTVRNVREGTAHYVEQTHIEILNGDTVNNYKTYEIVWNQNTK
jgi:hypothetical protein